MTEIDSTREMTRSEVAEYLRAFAAELDTATLERPPGNGTRRDVDPDDPRVTFMVGDDSATINPPEQLSFEVAVESDDPLVGSERDYEVSFELSWQAEQSDDSERNPELEVR